MFRGLGSCSYEHLGFLSPDGCFPYEISRAFRVWVPTGRLLCSIVRENKSRRAPCKATRNYHLGALQCRTLPRITLNNSRHLRCTVVGPIQFNLDFGSPPGELRYYLWISSNYASRYRVCGIFQGGWNLKSRTYSGPMIVKHAGTLFACSV